MTIAAPADREVISASLSLYLDLVRLIAALWVMLAHVRALPGGEALVWLPQSGHDAVTVFFVLSGFVIAHSAWSKRDQGLRAYALDRAARILSVTVPLLAITYGIAVILGILGLAPLAYQFDKLWLYVPLFLANIHQFWLLREVPPFNVPWWSLSFEVWYYVVFGLLAFQRDWKGPALAAAVALAAGYKLWLLAPLWAGGVALYRSPLGTTWSRPVAWTLLFGTVATYLLIEWSNTDWILGAASQKAWTLISDAPLGEARRFLADYTIGTLIILHLAAARRVAPRLDRFAPVIRTGAGMSFTLYLLHAPLIAVAQAALGNRIADSFTRLELVIVILVVTACVAQVSERQRGHWRRMLARVA